MSRKTFGDAGKYWFQMSMMSWTNISYIHNCIDTSYWYINLNKHQWWFDQKPLMIWRNISVLTIVLIKASCSNIDLNKHKQGFDQRSTMIWSNINNDLIKYQQWFEQISMMIWPNIYCMFTIVLRPGLPTPPEWLGRCRHCTLPPTNNTMYLRSIDIDLN